jgi:N-formylglutamate amidohydrolase
VTLRRKLLRLLLGWACVLCGAAIAAGPESLVISRSGNLPILLTAPHGGTERVADVPARRHGVTTTDARTSELTLAVAKRIEEALGAEPYVVAARFKRQYIDANRAETEALESPAAKPAYAAYHDRIRAFVSEIRRRFPQGGLLLDIHGQSDDPGVVHRGTKDGATVAALIRRGGEAALTGPQSVFGALQSRGYQVFPPNTPLGDPREFRKLNGGYTVQTYGSGRPDGIDAIQVEVGRDLRTDPKFTGALAEAIVVFYRAYLMDGKQAR